MRSAAKQQLSHGTVPPMKVHVVFAHPAEDSFGAALHRRLVEALRERGDEVADFDLYSMGSSR